MQYSTVGKTGRLSNPECRVGNTRDLSHQWSYSTSTRLLRHKSGMCLHPGTGQLAKCDDTDRAMQLEWVRVTT